MSVRAKFRCDSITDNGETKEIILSAAASSTGENVDFTKYAPSGDMRITTWPNTPAYNLFRPGKNYYLDFTEVEE